MIVTQIMEVNGVYTFALKTMRNGKLEDIKIYSYNNCAEAYMMHQRVQQVKLLLDLGN